MARVTLMFKQSTRNLTPVPIKAHPKINLSNQMRLLKTLNRQSMKMNILSKNLSRISAPLLKKNKIMTFKACLKIKMYLATLPLISRKMTS